MDEALKVFDDEISFVCEKLKVPPRLRFEWDDSWEANLEELSQNHDERVNLRIKYQQIEAKTEENLKSIAESFDNSKFFWARSNFDPTNNQGATYIYVDCFRKDDILAKRYIASTKEWFYPTLKSPERLRIQISKVGKVAVYANTGLEIAIEDAYEIEEGWFDVEKEILEKLKELGFFIVTKEQMKRPIIFEFDKENSLHVGILNGTLDSNLYSSQRELMVYDLFFSWTD
jgi:hypothetical protein